MSNILILDTLGERYGMLPSEILARGSTLDLYVLDVATSWHDYQTKKSQNKYTETLSQEEMMAMMAKAKQGVK